MSWLTHSVDMRIRKFKFLNEWKLFIYSQRCDAVSDIAELISGVVQSSGIGPVIFLAYINELIYI